MRGTIKKNAMVLVALAIAATGMSFMNEANKDNVSSKIILVDEYWDYIGAPNPINNNPKDPNQYELATQNVECDTGSEPCQVYAPSNGHPTNPKPDFSQPASGFSSQTVQQRVENALEEGANETLTMKN